MIEKFHRLDRNGCALNNSSNHENMTIIYGNGCALNTISNLFLHMCVVKMIVINMMFVILIITFIEFKQNKSTENYLRLFHVSFALLHKHNNECASIAESK